MPAPTWPPPAPWTGIHAAVLALAGLLLLYANRDQWFFGDEWDFIAERGLRDATYGLFFPHNEHWTTLPILVYRGLLNVVGLHHYWPYVAVLVALHLTVTSVLWRQLLLLRVHPALATAGTAVFAVLGAGSENLLWAFQIGFVGSVALGWLEVSAMNRDHLDLRRHLLGWALALAGLMCSGVGVTFVVVATLLVLARHGVRAAATHAVVPGTLFLLWYAAVGHGATTPTERPGLGLFVHYVAVGVTNALGAGLGGSLVGAPVLLVLVGSLWALRRELRGPAAVVAAGFVGALLQFSIAGVGRATFGLEQAKTGRYVYIGVALMLPLVLLTVDRVARRGPAWAPAAAAIFLVLPATLNARLLLHNAGVEAALEQRLKDVILAAPALIDTDEALVRTTPEPFYSPNLTVAGVQSLRARGWLPVVEPSVADVMSVRANLQTILRPDTDDAPTGAAVTQVVRLGTAAAGAGCIDVTPTEPESPQIVLTTGPGGGTVDLVPGESGNVLVFVSGGSPAVVGAPSVQPVEAGRRYQLQVVAAETSAIVTLPGGSTRVCAVQLPTAP